MTSDTPRGKAAKEEMAKASGTDLAGFDAQLATTADVLRSRQGGRVHQRPGAAEDHGPCRATSCSSHGILGTNAASVDVVGMSFPGGTTLGDADNVKLRFDPAFMALAAAGSL